jgi:pimeloyl-ACP methyl ester carboxylesterase
MPDSSQNTSPVPGALANLTRMLDADRLGGLIAGPDGRLYATVTGLDAAGSAYATRLVEIDPEAVSGTIEHPAPAPAAPSGRGDAAATTGVRALVWPPASVGAVAAGADGLVYFTAKRQGADGTTPDDPALFVLPARGEARLVAVHPGGFTALQVRGDSVIAEVPLHTGASTEEQHVALSAERKDAKVSAIMHEGFPTRYWNADLGPARQVLAVIDPAAPEVSRLSYPQMPHGRMLNWKAAPDGTRALVTVERTIGSAATGGTDLQCSEVHLVDLTGAARPRLLLAGDSTHAVQAGEISPAGTRAVLTLESRWTPDQSLGAQVLLADLETAAVAPLWPAHDFWFDPVWLDEHTLVATSDDHGRGSVWIGGVDEEAPRRLAGGPEGRHSFSGLEVLPATAAGDGASLVAAASAVDEAPLPVRIDPATGAVTRLPNPATALRLPGALDEVRATAADGTTIRAWLALPEGAGPHPLLVFVHGGPWGSWNAWSFRWNPGPFLAAGYAVLLPDPAISTGYGQDFIDRGQQEIGGSPFTDIMTLAQAAWDRPDVDSVATALLGGSYGGYMANWVAGQTGDRFKCIVTHAAQWSAKHKSRTSDNSSWDRGMGEQYETYSADRYCERIEVPMLITHGNRDYRVPIAQGQELWFDLLTKSRTPLDATGKTQHRFLFFPDEAHWIMGRGNAQVWYETVLGFVDQHVLGYAWDRPATLG